MTVNTIRDAWKCGKWINEMIISLVFQDNYFLFGEVGIKEVS